MLNKCSLKKAGTLCQICNCHAKQKSRKTWKICSKLTINCNVWCYLVLFIKFKKCEKHPTLLHEHFLRFLNCTDGAKLRKASQLFKQANEGSDIFQETVFD